MRVTKINSKTTRAHRTRAHDYGEIGISRLFFKPSPGQDWGIRMESRATDGHIRHVMVLGNEDASQLIQTIMLNNESIRQLVLTEHLLPIMNEIAKAANIALKAGNELVDHAERATGMF